MRSGRLPVASQHGACARIDRKQFVFRADPHHSGAVAEERENQLRSELAGDASERGTRGVECEETVARTHPDHAISTPFDGDHVVVERRRVTGHGAESTHVSGGRIEAIDTSSGAEPDRAVGRLVECVHLVAAQRRRVALHATIAAKALSPRHVAIQAAVQCAEPAGAVAGDEDPGHPPIGERRGVARNRPIEREV